MKSACHYCLLVLLLVGFLVVLSVPGAPGVIAQETTPTLLPGIPDGYSLVFEDTFDQEGLDTTKWQFRYENGRPYGAGVAAHSAVQQPGDGYLHLVTSYQNGDFLTGMIRSVEEFQYGYFEARIRFQALQGHHGAFWLQSPLYGQYLDDPARSGAEIDIIEFFGNGRTATDAKQNVYWNAYGSEDLQGRLFEVFYRDQYGVELSEEFHVFALQWTPDEYVFFIDGVEIWRTSEGVSHTPQFIILSLTTTGWENGRLDVNRLPDEMQVDYVRVFMP